ncbi:hypothetical protein BDZ89DRAFT_1234584 [Hymenopellis radicata]|nr:hypothetical protein BDZ89DRAFT_1234584 [Hymenopellis radicata]
MYCGIEGLLSQRVGETIMREPRTTGTCNAGDTAFGRAETSGTVIIGKYWPFQLSQAPANTAMLLNSGAAVMAPVISTLGYEHGMPTRCRLPSAEFGCANYHFVTSESGGRCYGKSPIRQIVTLNLSKACVTFTVEVFLVVRVTIQVDFVRVQILLVGVGRRCLTSENRPPEALHSGRASARRQQKTLRHDGRNQRHTLIASVQMRTWLLTISASPLIVNLKNEFVSLTTRYVVTKWCFESGYDFWTTLGLDLHSEDLLTRRGTPVAKKVQSCLVAIFISDSISLNLIMPREARWPLRAPKTLLITEHRLFRRLFSPEPSHQNVVALAGQAFYPFSLSNFSNWFRRPPHHKSSTAPLETRNFTSFDASVRHAQVCCFASLVITAVSLGEPVLLTGETGGSKPVDARVPASALQQRFLDLFGSTFSRRKNEKFETEVRKAGKRENDFSASEVNWNAFENGVGEFEVHHVLGKSKFAFDLVEGPLVKAVKNGEWSAQPCHVWGSLRSILQTRRFPVLIEGPTSSSKSSSVEYLAKKTGHRFEYLGSDLIAGKLVFQDGLLVRALRNGDWIVLDELNLAPTDVLEALNRLLDDNRELIIPETQAVVKPHPHFMIFATQNPASDVSSLRHMARRLSPCFASFRTDAGLDGSLKANLGTADNGYMLLAERARRLDDKVVVKEAIEKDMESFGCGKTSVCQVFATSNGQNLDTLNCQGTETADLIGGLRPIRNRSSLEADVFRDASTFLRQIGRLPEHVSLESLAVELNTLRHASSPYSEVETMCRRIGRLNAIFEWHNGPLVEAMEVLERLNSVFESSRTMVLAEKGGDHASDAALAAVDAFNLVANTNPGGDYGEKELSPALRNRFVEIWAPSVDNRVDLQLIVSRTWQSDELKRCTSPILDFVDWLCGVAGDRSLMNLRDVLAWVDFSNRVFANGQSIPGDIIFLGIHVSTLWLFQGGGSTAERRRGAPSSRVWQHSCPHTTLDPSTFLQLSSFAILKGQYASLGVSFNFNAPTTQDNATRVIHQTDLADLFGSDLSVEGGSPGEFAWKNAEFLNAFVEGHWVLLNEMNLAPRAYSVGISFLMLMAKSWNEWSLYLHRFRNWDGRSRARGLYETVFNTSTSYVRKPHPFYFPRSLPLTCMQMLQFAPAGEAVPAAASTPVQHSSSIPTATPAAQARRRGPSLLNSLVYSTIKPCSAATSCAKP